jgi:acetyl-CoA/propionyl-CoA carboxylase biotin carboxyl carrier protein
MMFMSVLIANRGEIAVRVIRACRELGIRSVAVCSDVDRDALHTRLADLVIPLGGQSARESYLDIERVVDAARRSDAEAVHPGYGFLSERAGFARACEAAGLTFVGPPPDAIAQMGSKTDARALAIKAGVPVVPGEVPGAPSDDAVADAVRRVGFPALLKPSAGGGGIGMRVIREPAEAAEAIRGARRDARAAFGDDTLYVERLVERPRHVEIQVFGDRQGQMVHVLERECSLQRRHQKVIEECPSPAVTPRLRARMGDAAVTVARAAGYVNAGTVEFLLEGEGDDASFYFLEMNTRLQVEHPVTEMVAGVDLVHAQLAVASGEALPWRQQDLTPRGHAIECRVYAEDPSAGFLPQSGRVLVFRAPAGPGIRVDAGIVEGDAVPVQFDPLIAKVIAHAPTRHDALARARAAMSGSVILGVRTNAPFLRRVLGKDDVLAGRIDTGWLDRNSPSLIEVTEPTGAAVVAAAAALGTGIQRVVSACEGATPHDPWHALTGWRNGA